MTLAIRAGDLTETVAARWQRRLSGERSGDKSHWRTKVAYYRAVDELVSTRAGSALNWRSIVAAVRPRGSRSTFYEVAGQHARHPLVGDLIRDGQLDSIQLVLCYRRASAVAHLLDEVKVWSFWPYRERLLAAFAAEAMSSDAMAKALINAVSSWARHNPRLAATLDYAPPMCAVEDLVVIMAARLSVVRAASILIDQVRCALGTRS